MGWAQVANVVASALIGVAAAVFVAAYAVLAPWRRSEMGRHVMAFSAAVGLLGVYTVLVVVWPHGVAATVLRVIRVALLVTLAGLLVQRTRLLVRAQRGGIARRARHGKRA
jgi:hypothetical protein